MMAYDLSITDSMPIYDYFFLDYIMYGIINKLIESM